MNRRKRTGRTLAVVSSKGGVGKTAVSVALATLWANAGEKVLLVDLDSQDTNSAAWWLERTDDSIPNLEWAKVAAVTDAEPEPDHLVILDTPPRIESAELVATATAADLVIVPGAPAELATVVQTARTIQAAAPDVPIGAVFTRATSQQLGGAWALAANEALTSIGVEMLGQMRQHSGVMAAAYEGRRIDQLSGRANLVREDIEQLGRTIRKKLN